MTAINSQQYEPEVRDKAIRLYRYLKEFTELRTRIIRTSDQYDSVIWFNEIPQDSGCYCTAWQPTDHTEEWIRTEKPRFKDAPPVPTELSPWLYHDQILDSSRDLLDLRECITVEDDVLGGDTISHSIAPRLSPGTADRQLYNAQVKELKDAPEIAALWEEYVETQWWPWAEKDRRLKNVQRIYTDLRFVLLRVNCGHRT